MDPFLAVIPPLIVFDFSWMAPEIIQDPRSFTYKADVYSFGMVLYEMFTKKSPLPPDVGSLQLAQRILHEDYRPPLPDDLLSEYRQLIQLCWDKNPDKRPDFSEILNVLRSTKDKLPAFDTTNYVGDDSSTGRYSSSALWWCDLFSNGLCFVAPPNRPQM